MARPKLDATAKTEAAAARQAAFAPRRDTLRAVGTALHGDSWISPLAVDLSRVHGRKVLRGTVSQWDALHRQVPAWAWDALGQLARDGATNLRERAAELDNAFTDAVPPSTEEPPVQDEDASERIEAAVAEAVRSSLEAADEDAEVDAIHNWMGSLPPPEPTPAPVLARPETWTSRASQEGYSR